MLLRIVGAICVVAGCGSVGFRISALYRHEEKCLRQLFEIVSYMGWELTYRMTPLPALCRQASKEKEGIVYSFFRDLADELDSQISPDVAHCNLVCLEKQHNIPPITRNLIQNLGECLGQFDFDGQVNCLNAVKNEIQQQLEQHCKNKNVKIRSYQTLGLCAGAAIAILFM